MRCVKCGSSGVSERPERTAQGYRRFRCHACGKQFNERSTSLLNRTQYPSDVVALVVLWRLRYKLSLRDLAEMFLIRGIVFSYEAVRDWEAELTPALADSLRRRRRRGKVGRSCTTKPTSKFKAAGATSIVPSTHRERWWTLGWGHAIWRPRGRSSAPPNRSPASRQTGSRRTDTTVPESDRYRTRRTRTPSDKSLPKQSD